MKDDHADSAAVTPCPERPTLEREGAQALKLMEKALELIDSCEGIGAIAAHLDFAICRLRAAISPELSQSDGSVRENAVR